MYISFDFILQRMSMTDFLVLQSIKQKDLYHKIIDDECIERLVNEGFLGLQKNGEPKLTKAGNSFLHAATDAPASPEIIKLRDELCSMYESQNKPIGKKMEVASRLSWFVNASFFNDNIIKSTVAEYLASSGKYTSSLENLIWKPANIMTVHKNLKDSMLFDLIVSKNNAINLDFYFDPKYQTKSLKYAIAVSKLPDPAANIPKEMTMTGSREGDIKAIREVKRVFFNYIRKKEED